MTARLVFASLVFVLIAAGTASAEPDSGSSAPPGLTPPAEAPVMEGMEGMEGMEDHDGQPSMGESEWYGLPILLADGLVVGLTMAAFGNESAGISIAAGALWTFGGPIVHWARGEKRNAAISVGLRLGLPVVGAIVGFRSAGPCGSSCSDLHGVLEGAVGVLVGGALASFIDIAVVARSTPKRVETTAWAPLLKVSDSQVTAGVAGWF